MKWGCPVSGEITEKRFPHRMDSRFSAEPCFSFFLSFAADDLIEESRELAGLSFINFNNCIGLSITSLLDPFSVYELRI